MKDSSQINQFQTPFKKAITQLTSWCWGNNQGSQRLIDLIKSTWTTGTIEGDVYILTKEDGQGIGAANQLIQHVTIDSFDGVDQFSIVLVCQPLIKQFTTP